MRKILIITMMISLMLPVALAEPLRIFPSDDSFVSSDDANGNHGGDFELRSGFQQSLGTQESYFIFDLSSLTGENVISAEFSLEVTSKTDDPVVELHEISSTSWNEGTIKWNNKPSVGSLISSQSVSSLDRIGFDVTSYVSSNLGEEISLALTEDGGDGFIQAFSKEFFFDHSEDDSERWPYLEVEIEGGEPSICADADSGGNGEVSLTEYTDFKYGFKNGFLPDVTLTHYNDNKYAYKNGLC